MTSRLRVAVVGHGLMGRRRSEAVLRFAQTDPRVSLYAVADPDPSALAGLPEGVHTARTVHGLPQGGIDCMFVCLPHGEVDREVERGRSPLFSPLHIMRVLVEKPGPSRLDALPDEHNKFWLVGLNYRLLPHVRAALRLLANGELGRLRSVEVTLGHGGKPQDRGTWKARESVLVDLGSHAFDLALLAEPSLRVTSAAASAGFWGGAHEDAVALMQSPGGAVATVRVSTVRWCNEFCLALHGEEGYAVAEGRGGYYGPMTLRYGRRWAWRGTVARQRELESASGWGDDDHSVADETDAALSLWLGEPDEDSDLLARLGRMAEVRAQIDAATSMAGGGA